MPRSTEPLHFVVVTVDMGGCPESVEAKKSASRPLLAAGPPMNTSRGDTSRGIATHLELDAVDIDLVDGGQHPTPCYAARS